MADLMRKYERVTTESSPSPRSKSTPKRSTSPFGSSSSSRHADISGFLTERRSPHSGGLAAGDSLPCFCCDQLFSTANSREKHSTKRKSSFASENRSFENENSSTCPTGNGSVRRGAVPLLESREKPEKPLSPAAAAASHDAVITKTKMARTTTATTTSGAAAEIEAWLSAMEKEEQKRFAEKYNYDIVKDVPTEGRYEWIPVESEFGRRSGGGSGAVTDWNMREF